MLILPSLPKSKGWRWSQENNPKNKERIINRVKSKRNPFARFWKVTIVKRKENCQRTNRKTFLTLNKGGRNTETKPQTQESSDLKRDVLLNSCFETQNT